MHELEKNILYLFKFIPLPSGAVMPWVATGLLVLICWMGSRRLSLVPSPLQNFLEWVYEGLSEFVAATIGGPHAREHVPFFMTFFLYILVADLLGSIPGLKSSTATFTNCLTLALISFTYVQYLGFKHHGLSYLKHFIGEPRWMAPLMLPIHVIGEFARPVSLSFRLFGNIFGEDVVVIVLTTAIFPLLVPLPMLCLQVFTDIVQALVFTTLSCVYVSGALAAGDHH